MKVEIQRLSNDPANTMLEVYSNGIRPICKIWEEDFIEILSERQFKLLEKGEHTFNVSHEQLFMKSKVWFR